LVVDPPVSLPKYGIILCHEHKADEGDCAAQFVRWFWNTEARTCQSFSYSGCNGNGNNFASRQS
jgi:hypothetical protein